MRACEPLNLPYFSALETVIMWKIALAFALFAALALWMPSKGANVDMGGEKHGVEVATDAPASASASAPAPAASAASQ
jgi:hypothetical protein